MSDVKQQYRELNSNYLIPIEAKTVIDIFRDHKTVRQFFYFRKFFLFENPILIGIVVFFSSWTIYGTIATFTY